jgi:5-formyltetrahydrofolate cyclo-ligase
MASRRHGFIPSSAEDLLRQRVKAELRKRMRGLRNAVPAAACAERSARIVERLAALPPLARANAVGLFWPIAERHEVDLRSLDERLRARGARIAYPAVDPETRAMVFRWVAHPDQMQEQGFGFREPAPTAPEVAPGELEAIVAPALAVDPVGHRIGYGAGYYDATLPAHAPPAATVAVAFDFQVIAEVPATTGDVRLDWVVTDAREIFTKS